MGKRLQLFYYLGLIFQLGLAFFISVAIGLAAGIFFDKKLNSSPLFTVIFLIFGVIGGFMSAYRLIKEDFSQGYNAGSKDDSN